jgi:hypothetical protein
MEGFQRRRDEVIAWLQGDTPSNKRAEKIEGLTQDALGRESY